MPCPLLIATSFRDWSVITGTGATKRERRGGGVVSEVLPLQKGGAEQVLATLKSGHNKFWGSFNRLEGGGGQKVSDPRFSHSVGSPSP